MDEVAKSNLETIIEIYRRAKNQHDFHQLNEETLLVIELDNICLWEM